MADANLTAERVREVLHYDPETGVFTWAKDVMGGHGKRQVVRRQGELVGCKSQQNGYILLRIDRRLYLAHRAAWLYVHGDWPCTILDHINGIRDDNRIANLREARGGLNSQNLRGPKKRKLDAPLGVSFQPRGRRKWLAQITVDGACHYLGAYGSPDEAHQAYLAAKRRLHEGCTI